MTDRERRTRILFADGNLLVRDDLRRLIRSFRAADQVIVSDSVSHSSRFAALAVR